MAKAKMGRATRASGGGEREVSRSLGQGLGASRYMLT